jgi:pSer/pThr/pTyr-binding forkhead associated (FHA) protein
MSSVVLPILQALFLVLLYLFVWRIARAIVRDLRSASSQRPAAAQREAVPAAPRAQPQPAPRGESRRESKAKGEPRELVVRGGGRPPQILALNGSEVTFGRSAPSTVVLDDPYVSDRHARIRRERDLGWVVTDLGSTNGTFLNQVKLSRPTPISPGDQLGIGRSVVEVRS